MSLKNEIYEYIESNRILMKNIPEFSQINLNEVHSFEYYDLLDCEYLENILIMRKKNFDEKEIEYFHLKECINDLKKREGVKVKWIPIKFNETYVVFVFNQKKEILTFFGFKQ